MVVQDLATQWIQSYSCKTKNFSKKPEEPSEVPEAHEKTKVIYTDNSPGFVKFVKILLGIIVRQHRTGRTLMDC